MAPEGAPGASQAAAVDVELVVEVDVEPVVDVELVVDVVDDEVVLEVDPVVVDVDVVVVVVHGAVTVTVVPGPVTVTVFVLVFGVGHRPSLSPRRKCPFTALPPTVIVTRRFDPVRWHIVTFFGFFLANDAFPATAIEPAKPARKSASRAALSFNRFTPSDATFESPAPGSREVNALR